MIRSLALACLLSAAVALAQQPDQLSANDKDFIEFAGETSLLAVRIGQMAQLQASSPQVKKFAVTLEQEHTADLKKLMTVANKTGGIAPTTLDDTHQNAVKRLHKSKGKPFDHAFLKVVVNEHENALVSYKREADHGFTPSLQAYAKATLPQLEHHLKLARQLASDE